ncbi:hypothetical protein KZX37_00215 [Microbacterium sp. EYE_5]|uniref:hypothetical protein n=1 Tax=unclassified Microbacterium TaxID=2609290 RepID=UPI0020041D65|nr:MULTISPECIES: hypothetical protein [unclassified Microbacterium]MCK6079036.1 hypothetical protein [Microbacterium sp. EYE_382]MCK6084306.1 hypothetical protein [Microbacterium sp. EYE_384]MCK6123465.1 hypothetical protein [Microbacterium sp. EYE_80]MCK6125070.1 hypothetical protein [Microbacterium sp. EYE_79]MCK6139990.1 hypothetical protein [Microbacterium sp. EYE_39]
MSNPNQGAAHHTSNVTRRIATETKSAFKATEFYAWLVVSIAILIAAAVTDNGEDGQGFGADHAWQYVAIVTAAYIVSRGIAKAGTRGHEDKDA